MAWGQSSDTNIIQACANIDRLDSRTLNLVKGLLLARNHSTWVQLFDVRQPARQNEKQKVHLTLDLPIFSGPSSVQISCSGNKNQSISTNTDGLQPECAESRVCATRASFASYRDKNTAKISADV